MKLNCRLHIGAVTSTNRDGYSEYVTIEFTDESSSTRFLEAKLSLEDFGKLMAFNTEVETSVELRGLDKLGKKRENKTEKILCRHQDFNKIGDLIKEFEVDGWKASNMDLKRWNHHRQNGDYYSVGFVRYV
jgi:hypothetical protein